MIFEEKMQPSLPSAKRTPNEKTGVHSWHPYYAGYSEAFVLGAIRYLNLQPGQIVIDPWIGSGTTNLVCEKIGLRSLGFDLNPVMTIFANAKNAPILNETENEIYSVADQLFEKTRKNIRKIILDDHSELSNLINPKAARRLIGLTKNIGLHPFKTTEIDTELSKIFSNDPTSKDRCFFQAAAFILARELAGDQNNSNPTWLKSSLIKKSSPTYSQMQESYKSILNKMIDSSKNGNLTSQLTATNIAIVGNSKSLPIEANSVDGVIGSPPYLTRIDYAVSTRIELGMLVGDTEYRHTRNMMMGSTTVPKTTPVVLKEWGATCCDCLEQIFAHPSKASRTYYYRNIANYFNDAFLSISETKRVLKPGGRALIVVQSSYYKSIKIPLGEIYCEMASSIGLDSRISSRELVKNHIAYKNSKSMSYLKKRIYHEDVVELVKPTT